MQLQTAVSAAMLAVAAVGANEAPTDFTSDKQHTTHFVVADAQGNVVCATQTIGNLFGSKVMVKGTGIWLNDSLAYSTFEPKGNPMDAFAGRRKLAGFCPMIVMRGRGNQTRRKAEERKEGQGKTDQCFRYGANAL